jgi:hypothetical protein
MRINWPHFHGYGQPVLSKLLDFDFGRELMARFEAPQNLGQIIPQHYGGLITAELKPHLLGGRAGFARKLTDDFVQTARGRLYKAGQRRRVHAHTNVGRVIE